MLKIQSADEAEIVFYESFMHGDLEVMNALWADDDIICVHPGSAAIIGREAVLRSWQHILSGANLPEVKYQVLHKFESSDMVVHIVTEQMMQNAVTVGVVLATNVYRHYAQGWRMVEHHGSLVQSQRREERLQ